MKFRIITNGVSFRIQQKGWFFWNTIGTNTRGGGIIPHSFISEELAINFIREYYGEEAVLVRQWRPI